MNIMVRLTWRQMLMQKRRTLITILGVIVSVAMIAAVSSFGASFMGLFQKVQLAYSGEWHVQFEGVSGEGIAALADEACVRAVYAVDRDEAEKLPARHGRYYHTRVYRLSAEGMGYMQVLPEDGRLPEAAGECVVSSNYAKAAGYRVGDTLVAGGRTLTIVGLCAMTPLEPSVTDEAAVLTCEEAIRAEKIYETVSVVLKAPDSALYDWARTMRDELGAAKYSANSTLLIYMGVGSDRNLMLTIYLMAGFFMLIILAASISLIYNSFAISVTDRCAYFGMLSSIGATGGQRRRAVLFEALVIGAFAIPLGLVFGYLGIGITFRVVSGIMQDMFNMPAALSLVVVPEATLGAVLLSLATLLISAWIPARRAARVSPMEAIRRTQDVKLTARAVRTSRLTRALFGFEAELALKNLRRNKRRYRVTQISLVTSLVLFLSACALTYYLSSSYEMTGGTYAYDICALTYADESEDAATRRAAWDALNESLRETPGAEEVSQTVLCNDEWRLADSTKLTDALLKANGGVPAVRVSVLALGEEALRAYAARTGASYEELTDSANPAAILVNEYVFKGGSSYTQLSVADVRVGETLSLTGDIWTEDGERTGARQAALRLAALTGERPAGVSEQISTSMMTVSLVVSRDTMDALFADGGLRGATYICCADDAAAEEWLIARAEALQDEASGLHMSVINITNLQRRADQMMLVINIFVYGFIGLLSLIAIANIVGTISTSLALRKRELAMIKSVGITPRGFNRMIRYESLLYGLKAVLYGLPLSYLAMYLMWRTMGMSFEMPFDPLFVQAAIGVLGIFCVVFLTMAYSSHKLKRDSIIDGLRADNL